MFNRSGLLQDFNVRKACTSDIEAVENIVDHIDNKESLLADLLMYTKAKRDPVSLFQS